MEPNAFAGGLVRKEAGLTVSYPAEGTGREE